MRRNLKLTDASQGQSAKDGQTLGPSDIEVNWHILLWKCEVFLIFSCGDNFGVLDPCLYVGTKIYGPDQYMGKLSF